MKKILLSLLCATLPVMALAYDFEVDGIYYNKLSDGNVEVTYQNGKFAASDYIGTVTIPSTVTYDGATYTVTKIGDAAFWQCDSLNQVTIPGTVVTIGSYAFTGCSGLASVEIPASVTTIDWYAFSECISLTSITLPNSVTSLGSDVFSSCSNLKTVKLSENLTKIPYYTFSSCTSLVGIEIPEGVTRIESCAFSECSSLASVSFPATLERISSDAFYQCTSLTSVTLPDGLQDVSYGAFDSGTKIYVNKGSNALLALWREYYVPLEAGTGTKLPAPHLEYKSTQTTVRFKVLNVYNDYVYYLYTKKHDLYTINDDDSDFGEAQKIENGEIKLTGLAPGDSYDYYDYGLQVMKPDSAPGFNDYNYYTYYYISGYFHTESLQQYVEFYGVTASSLSASCSFDKDDAEVVKEEISQTGTGDWTTLEDEIDQGSNHFHLNHCLHFSGLDPDKSFTLYYRLTLADGSTYVVNNWCTTKELELTTQAPRVVSEGNVIFMAASNLDKNETNVGFEWRRTDWDDTFESRLTDAYAYYDYTQCVMVGFPEGINAKNLYKYRPYYESASGTRYYGDWLSIDPTEVGSYEPLVYTYNVSSSDDVSGNTAKVKGFAVRGTEDVVSRGFCYWKEDDADVRGVANTKASIPSTAQRVTVDGDTPIMEATLTGLDYEEDYEVAAFLTTQDGTTYYGDTESFYTDEAPTGIGSVTDDAPQAQYPAGIYDLQGRKLTKLQRGVNIVRQADGSSRKVYVK